MNREPDDRPVRKHAPFDRVGTLSFIVSYVALTVVFTAIGRAIVRWWEPSAWGQADGDVNRWFADRRTDSRTEIAEIGSSLSDTMTMVGMVIVLLPVMLWVFKRWHDWSLLAFGLLLEVAVFASASLLVGRERPPVEQLDGAPTGSFPSGHIAAAVVFYGGTALIIAWNDRGRAARALAIALGIGAPVAVVLSRMYLGMHYVTDAIGGVILGVLCIVIVRWALLRTIETLHRDELAPRDLVGAI